jgi:predicted nucleic acid-binding protein
MRAKCFVDTSVLIYAHDASAGTRHDLARGLVSRLWADGGAVISTQVLQEFAVNILRKTASPPSPDVVREWLADYLEWELVVNDGAAVLEALECQARYQLSFWDALIVQAANAAQAEVLYSEDLNHGQVYGGVRVENPFRATDEAA